MRYLHTMLRVRNLDTALKFYCDALGLKEVRRIDNDKGRFTLVFLGAAADEQLIKASPGRGAPLVELTYNWDVESYALGEGFGHIAIEVDDAYAACAEAKKNGGTVVREAGPMKHGTTVIAFLSDPDGYKIELIEHKGTR